MSKWKWVGLAALMWAAPMVAQPLSRVTILDLTALATVDTDDKLFVHDTSASAMKSASAAAVRRRPASTSLPGTCTVGDEYVDTDATDKSCVCTATNTWSCSVDASSTNIAPYGQYDADNPSGCAGDSGAVCKEFTGTGYSCTWGNQDSSTVTNSFDGLLFAGDTAANEQHVCGEASPSSGNVDFTVTAKVQYVVNGTSNDGCILGMIEAGTVATPTELTFLEFIESTTDVFQFYTATDYAYASASAVGSTVTTTMGILSVVPQCVQLRYTDSSRDTTAWYSLNCVDFYQIGSSATLSADPPFFYFGARDGGTCRFSWVRARTGSNRNQASD